MENRELTRNEWHFYFDQHSKILQDKQVEIEVTGLDIGDQLEQRWTGLSGLSYDAKDDQFSIFTAHVDHVIAHPQKIWVAEAGAALYAIEIEDSEGHKQIVKFRDPVMLGTTTDAH